MPYTRGGNPILYGTAGELQDYKKMMELWSNTGTHFVRNATTINSFKPYEFIDFEAEKENKEIDFLDNVI